MDTTDQRTRDALQSYEKALEQELLDVSRVSAEAHAAILAKLNGEHDKVVSDLEARHRETTDLMHVRKEDAKRTGEERAKLHATELSVLRDRLEQRNDNAAAAMKMKLDEMRLKYNEELEALKQDDKASASLVIALKEAHEEQMEVKRAEALQQQNKVLEMQEQDAALRLEYTRREDDLKQEVLTLRDRVAQLRKEVSSIETLTQELRVSREAHRAAMAGKTEAEESLISLQLERAVELVTKKFELESQEFARLAHLQAVHQEECMELRSQVEEFKRQSHELMALCKTRESDMDATKVVMARSISAHQK